MIPNNQFFYNNKNYLDINAKSFIDAAGITNPQQINAINRFVIDLKAINSIQSNFVNFSDPSSSIIRALYPFVGGTATTHKFNLIDPVDADASFRLAFGGGVTHDSTGVTPNGTTGFADTFLIPSTTLSANNTSEFYYPMINPVTLGQFCMGGRTSSSQLLAVRPYNTDNKVTTFQYNTTAGQGYLDTTNVWVKNNLGATIKQAVTKLIISNRYLTKNQLSINGVLDADTTNNGGDIPNVKTYLFGYNNVGTLASPTDIKCGLAGIGTGMSAAAMVAFNATCNTYQRNLGRYPVITSVQCVGDSITWGLSVPNVAPYPLQLQALYSFPSNITINNFGVSGKKLIDMITDYPTNEATYYFNKFDNNDLVLMAGVNDLGQDLLCTEQDLKNRYIAYFNLANATGFNSFVCELLPQSNPAYAARGDYEAIRQSINSWMTTFLLANGYVKGVVPTGSNPLIGIYGSQFNATYYLQNTMIHPTDTGSGVIASLVKTTLATYHGINI